MGWRSLERRRVTGEVTEHAHHEAVRPLLAAVDRRVLDVEVHLNDVARPSSEGWGSIPPYIMHASM